MIELLAITDDAARLPRPLHAVRCGALTAICGPPHEGEADSRALWEHERTVESLMRERDLLPVRYGTRLTDDDAVTRALADRVDELREALEHVRGAVELAVRASGTRPVPRTDSGADYLRAKLQGVEVADLVHGPLATLARDHAIFAGSELLRAAYLVDRAWLPDFTDLARRLQKALPQLDLTCTGPWPPYSFVERGSG